MRMHAGEQTAAQFLFGFGGGGYRVAFSNRITSEARVDFGEHRGRGRSALAVRCVSSPRDDLESIQARRDINVRNIDYPDAAARGAQMIPKIVHAGRIVGHVAEAGSLGI